MDLESLNRSLSEVDSLIEQGEYSRAVILFGAQTSFLLMLVDENADIGHDSTAPLFHRWYETASRLPMHSDSVARLYRRLSS